MTVAAGILITTIGIGYFLEDRYHKIKAADAYHQQHEAIYRADMADLELAQAQTADALTRDIQALRIQNITMELNAIYAREEARRSFPSDTVRKEQLLAQMAAIIAALER